MGSVYPDMQESVKNYKAGKVIPITKKKKVAILGTVPHKLQAPFDDLSFEIWAIAHACLGEPLKRVDRIFEIHKWEEAIKWKSNDAWEKLHPNIPVYLIEARKDVPNSISFPFKKLQKEFQLFEERKECYFTNSISEMVALAISEKFQEIHIYGVNMSHHTEYGFQKPSCEYFLGLAKGLGIKIYVPTESDLCKSFYIYGKEEEQQTDMIKKLEDRMQFLQNMHNQYRIQFEQSNILMNQAIGASNLLKDQDQENPIVQKKMKELTDEYQKQRMQLEQARDAIQQHIGAMEDVKFIMGLIKQ